jgi:hypothetical protein
VPAPIPAAASYRGYRFPPEIISYAVWLYLRFSLSLRDVEELLAERGVAVTYETIGQWVRRFGPVFAQELRQRGRRPGDKLHLDEVTLKINGRHWLWRAVGPARLRRRYPRAEPARSARGRSFHTTGGRRVGVHAAGGHHRQASELPTSPAARASELRASTSQGAE